MTIYTLCVDQERGRYLAVSALDPGIFATGSSEIEALGQLVTATPGIQVDNVVHIAWETK
jgi:hypothetical protein